MKKLASHCDLGVSLVGKCRGGFADVRFTDTDGVTLLPSWMDTLDLNEDAYTENSDFSGRCYIGFANFSQFFIENSTLGHHYSDFVKFFFDYALRDGPEHTVRDALDYAAQNTFDVEYFDQCPLYIDQTYTMWDARPESQKNVDCWMVVRGDGDCILWNPG